MINIHSNDSHEACGIKHYIVDVFNDLTNLQKLNLSPGSTIFISSTLKYYMLNGEKQWIEINPYSINSSQSSGNGSKLHKESYDGGSIDDSDPM